MARGTNEISDAPHERLAQRWDRLESGDSIGCGCVSEYQDIAIEEMSEEHGHPDISQASRAPQVGY